ncbi:nucleic acid/nucleotide deaminase domain-containing protein [Streptomyces sp. NPDC006638]|uniref:nucleic acid/nucleotide deaminase domain-containing protein n=1 Tax=Streptomyces sp. NPDC006638 TaxID=3157183 RepID=UPI0033BC588D
MVNRNASPRFFAPPGSLRASGGEPVNTYAAQTLGQHFPHPDGRGESILVGYSQKSLHSERSIGYPLLNYGKQDGLTEVFTEREPCQKRPRCDAWLDKYFKNADPVHHTNTYDQDVGRHKRDIENQQHMDELKAHHGR